MLSLTKLMWLKLVSSIWPKVIVLEYSRVLWDIEDKIRDKERNKSFDDEFIQLARSVYITNDERSRIKRRINETFGSDLIEEKSYAEY